MIIETVRLVSQIEGKDASAALSLRWAIARPQSLRPKYDFDLTAEILAEMAASYDPAAKEAVVNLDHIRSGPAHAAISALEWDGSELWATVIDLDDETRTEIRSGRWRQVSIEARSPKFSHTGTWYLTGLALLGAAPPLVNNLPQIAATEEPAPPAKEKTMPDTPPAAGGPAPAAKPTPSPPEVKTPSAPSYADVVELNARAEKNLQATEKALADTQKAVTVGQEKVRHLGRKGAELEATEQLARLGKRLTPAIRRLALPLLVELSVAETPVEITLSEDGKEDRKLPAAETLLELLACLPDQSALFAGELATGQGDPVMTPATIAAAEKLGFSAERQAELAAKYPGAYPKEVN